MLTFDRLSSTVALGILVAESAVNLCCSAASPAAPPAAAPAEAVAAVDSTPSEPTAAPDSAATLLRFLALGRGDQIADLGSGDGYSVLPFANAVGPFGRVYARHAPKLSQHLPSNAVYETPPESLPENIVLLTTPLEAPLPPQLNSLDAVTFLYGYDSLITEHRDRGRFNAAALKALKPGGLFVVAERSSGEAEPARVNAGRIRAEVEAAGFHFVEAADLQAPSGDAPAPDDRAPTIILKFQKAR